MKRGVSVLLTVCFLLSLFALPCLAEESSAVSQPSALSAFDKGVQVFSMVILFGGLALVPLYFVLNARRRKIVKSFSENENGNGNDENGDT